MGEAGFAVSTYSYQQGWTAQDAMTRAAELGFAEFELMVFPGHLWPDEMDQAARRALLRFVETTGLRVHTLSIANNDLNVASAYPGLRQYSVELLSSIVRLAGDLGVVGVVIGPGKPNPLFPLPTETLVGYFYGALDTLCSLAERVGTRICLENMPVGFLPGAAELMQALERYGDDRIGFVYDVANGHFIGEDVAAGLRRVASRLELVHVSDTTRRTYRHDAVGLGDVDFATLPPVLAEIGHTARPALEVISAQPDRDIVDSAARLAAMGWCDAPA